MVNSAVVWVGSYGDIGAHKLVVHGGFFGSQIYLVPQKKLGIAYMPTLKSSFAGYCYLQHT